MIQKSEDKNSAATDSLPDSMLNIVHLYRTAMRSSLKANESGLNAMYVKCLMFIHRREQCTANDIVNNLHRDKAQIARLIKEMISKNWLMKVSHPEDKRSQLLLLTKSGKELMAFIEEKQHHVHEKMQKNLTEEDIKTFIRITNMMANNLKKEE